MSQSSWLITGSSRGIGFEIVRQLAADPHNIVVATCRNPDSATSLHALKSEAKSQLYIVELDIADDDSITASAAETSKILGEGGLDYLINNAAISRGDDHAFDMKPVDMLDTFKCNVVAPTLVAQAFLPLLERGNRKVIMNTTSGLASFSRDLGKKVASYSITKTAVNMLTYKQATERPDVIAFAIDPGWVKTEMGGEGALLEPSESVTPMLKFISNTTHEHSGKFFDYRGEPVPW